DPPVFRTLGGVALGQCCRQRHLLPGGTCRVVAKRRVARQGGAAMSWRRIGGGEGCVGVACWSFVGGVLALHCGCSRRAHGVRRPWVCWRGMLVVRCGAFAKSPGCPPQLPRRRSPCARRASPQCPASSRPPPRGPPPRVPPMPRQLAPASRARTCASPDTQSRRSPERFGRHRVFGRARRRRAV
ncbi:MAG: hypothetical protein ACJA1R_001521, partial [Flavobacteriales bacterium]